ncbi:MAG: glycoside hydrolase domain-containing protein, partial [Armatimonadota bacterium]
WGEVALVDYVPVTIPTDAWGSEGEFPDPLVPLWRRDREQGTKEDEMTKAIEVQVENLQAGKNQPLWLTVFVPKGVPAGKYQANIRIVEAIGAGGKPLTYPSSSIPIQLRVFDFTLPDDTPLRTAYGVHIDNDWHRLKTQEQFRQVWDLYMQICRRYRISPYTPHAYAPIRWEAKGPRTTIDNGLLQLVIDRWQGRIATIARSTRQVGSGKELQPVPRPAPLVPLGGVLPVLEQFEREGVGWEGKGIGWAGTEVVKDVKVVERTEGKIVLDITTERLSSQPANRKFAATVRLTVEAGKPYFTVQMLKIVNTDTVGWRINGYYHLLPPDRRPISSVNTDRFGAWQVDDKPLLYFGAASAGFTYSLRINPITGHPHGDVYRQVGKWLEPGQTWEPTDEPVAFIFFWEGEASAEPQNLEKFIGQMLQGEIATQPESKLQIVEQPEPEFRYDFTEFDVAMSRYLDEFRFNGFNFVILPETLGGYERFTREWTELYRRLMSPILEHLKQKGWLSKAYCYWIDEPHTPEQYELTKRGMSALKEALPGVRRLLTNYVEKFPSPTFYGYVDLWVPIFNQFDERRAKERQALGEEVWWYVCTGPKAPYPNNFIDHPAITHRIRYWMAAKWNLDGDLYWSMTYYRGKGWRLRNPYEDGQSETPEGGYWGNGDGRLLYPPVRQPLPEGAEPVIAPPIPSLRLALIAEGIEDHCYLWLLKQLVDKGQKSQDKSKELREALKLADEALGALDRLIRSQTDYEQDPQKLYAERRKVAEAIEQLAKLLRE